jgi:hypothetical protein
MNPQPVRSDDDEAQWNLSERIHNWAKFTVERGWPSSTCRSVEGRYRPEGLQEGEEKERRTPKMTQADIDAHMADAWQVESAWAKLPNMYRFCIQYTYLKGDKDREGKWRRWSQQKIWRKLGPYRSLQVQVRDYDDLLRLARFALANQLRRQESKYLTQRQQTGV